MKKYLNIADSIEHNVLCKKYGEKLPTEQKLADEFDTSKIVISRALRVLVAKNILQVIQGSGIYVKKRDIALSDAVQSSANKHDGFVHSMMVKGEKVTSHIVSFYVRSPEPEEIEKLKINKQDKVYDIIRQRLVNGHPMKLEYTFMPVKVIPGINENVLHHSIYGYIRKQLHLEIGTANRIIAADRVDAFDQEYLDCKENDAVLSVHQLAFLKDGRPFELSETRDRYDRGGYLLFEVSND